MNTSIRTVSRVFRAPSVTRITGQGLTQTRRLTSTTTSESPSKRDSAVHDAIMDKLWGAGATQSAPASGSAPTATETPTQATFGSTNAPSEPARL
jgi:hypothetical protein